MSRLKKVKKANGQIIACNEVRYSSDRDEEHKALRLKRPRARATMEKSFENPRLTALKPRFLDDT